MTVIPFPKSSTPGSLPGESDGRLINVLVEQSGDSTLLRRAAGLSAIGTVSGYSTPRGMTTFGGNIYAAYSGQLVKWDTSGGSLVVLTGGLSGSGRVVFARNLKQPTADLVVVKEAGGRSVVNTTALTSDFYPDADLPTTVNSVAPLSSYLVYGDPTDNKIWASDLNATSQSALSYATAEATPGKLIRVVNQGAVIFAMCEDRIEPWLDRGTTPFPLGRHTTVIKTGLLEWGAVAGSVQGWDRPLAFVAHDGTVRVLDGYNAVPVSTPDVERFVADTVSAGSGNLHADVFTDRGQPIWSISSTTATWHYNLAQQTWTERQSGGSVWRARNTVKVGNTWFAQDLSSQSLLKILSATKQDVGTDLPFYAQSSPMKGFPKRAFASAAHLDFTRGNGGTVDFSFSKDGGRNWSSWENFSLGSTGEDDGPIIINRLGMMTTHGLIVRVRVTDTVDFSFMGGDIPGLSFKPEAPTPPAVQMVPQ
jgi:hypothetical protein